MQTEQQINWFKIMNEMLIVSKEQIDGVKQSRVMKLSSRFDDQWNYLFGVGKNERYQWAQQVRDYREGFKEKGRLVLESKYYFGQPYIIEFFDNPFITERTDFILKEFSRIHILLKAKFSIKEGHNGRTPNYSHFRQRNKCLHQGVVDQKMIREDRQIYQDQQRVPTIKDQK
ncbi:unnamed protein product [Paramecium octaurelia]|uniref:Uncharacterized protein n=1 Tax=Paramecium octaurelia TaxID=43137 RepID=A0A8S1YKN1_PAROT|nr:unnamed protein product [Paramecium octaurelia]CAD8215280.1 unnamed protein product [Paramecium octaurelia]